MASEDLKLEQETDYDSPEPELSEDEMRFIGQFWSEEIQSVTGDDKWKQWKQRCRRLTARYRDERIVLNEKENLATRYNTLWANIEYLTPAIYFQPPKPYVERRFLDRDDTARVASQILERSLSYNLDCEKFDSSMQKIMKDYFLAGRGVMRFMYKPYMRTVVEIDIDGQEIESEEIEYEEVKHQYVYNEDFIHGYARCWEEVPWVGFRSFMTRPELKERFGKETARKINLDYSPDMDPVDNFPYPNPEKNRRQKKAVIWEIWDKHKKEVVFFAPGSDNLVLEINDDPLGLEGFFPCPKPLYATMTNDTLVPIADFLEYQDQANQLDILTGRISALTRALRVSGVYDASAEGLQRLLSEATENQLIPVDNWAQLSGQGGLDRAVYMFPVKTIAETLLQLYQAREQVKKDLDEISGLYSVRSADNQTPMGAQKNLAKSGSLRLQQKQKLVAQFTADCVKLIAEIMCKHFQPVTFQLMADYAQIVDANQESFIQAVQLLKDKNMRKFRVDIEVDSTISLDEDKEKADRIEYAKTIVEAINQLGPVVEAKPNFAIAAKEIIMFIARGFKSGRSLETVLEQSFMQIEQMPEQPPQSEAAQQGHMQMQLQQMKTQSEMAKTQAKLQADILKSNQETKNEMILKGMEARNKSEELTRQQNMVQ